MITPKNPDTGAKSLGFSEREEKKIDHGWHESQKYLTTLSSDSKFIVVENSSHLIMYDKPEIIVKSVKEMIEQ